MEHRTTEGFWEEYGKLPLEIRRRADKQFALLRSDVQHRSLQLKKIGERHGQELWSVRVTLTHRAVAFRRDYGLLWFWIGGHETYETIIS